MESEDYCYEELFMVRWITTTDENDSPLEGEIFRRAIQAAGRHPEG